MSGPQSPPPTPADPHQPPDEHRPDATRVFPAYPAQPYPNPPYPGYPPQQGQYPPPYSPPRPHVDPHTPWGARPNPNRTPPSRLRRTALLVGGVVALAVIGLLVATVALSPAKTLDRGAAQQGVRTVLTTNYGVTDVGAVSCPSGVRVKPGDTFTCTVKVGDDEKRVTAKFTDSDGTYEVGRPA
jgi:hypothetical protein